LSIKRTYPIESWCDPRTIPKPTLWAWLILLPFLGCSSPSRVTRPEEPYKGPVPLAVLIERSPWMVAVGSDTPFFALYDNGLVIYLHQSRDGEEVYVSEKLSSKQFKKLRNQLKPTKAFLNLKSEYVTVLGSNQPRTIFYLSDGTQSKLVTVYGPVWNRYTQRLDKVEGWRGPDNLPTILGRLCEKAKKYRHPKATVWVPNYFELMVHPNMFGSLPRHWPKHWPGLADKLAWDHGDLTSVFVPGADYEHVQNYAHEHSDVVPLRMGASISTVRYVFPNEPMWLDHEWGIAKEVTSDALPSIPIAKSVEQVTKSPSNISDKNKSNPKSNSAKQNTNRKLVSKSNVSKSMIVAHQRLPNSKGSVNHKEKHVSLVRKPNTARPYHWSLSGLADSVPSNKKKPTNISAKVTSQKASQLKRDSKHIPLVKNTTSTSGQKYKPFRPNDWSLSGFVDSGEKYKKKSTKPSTELTNRAPSQREHDSKQNYQTRKSSSTNGTSSKISHSQDNNNILDKTNQLDLPSNLPIEFMKKYNIPIIEISDINNAP